MYKMRSSANSGLGVFLVVVSTGLAMTCVKGQLVDSLDQIESILDPSAPSEQQLRVASMMSGNFSNEEQVQKQTNKPVLGALIFPVRSKPLSPDVTFYVEQTVNGQVINRYAMVVQEDDDGGIRFAIYNLTLSLPDRPLSEIEILEFQNIAFNYLERYGNECDAIFYQTEQKMFYGTWPGCLGHSPEGIIIFPFLITCDGLSSQNPSGDPIPNLFKAAQRYPLLIHSYEHLIYDYCSSDNSCSKNY